MAKATLPQIQRLGFSAAQFGDPDDWLTPGTGYLAEILTSVGTFVRDEVGASGYDAATGSTLTDITEAEKALVSAELWRRRAAFMDSSASLGNSDSAYLIIREYLGNGDKAEERGLELIAKVKGSSVNGGIAVGVVESGHFVESTT